MFKSLGYRQNEITEGSVGAYGYTAMTAFLKLCLLYGAFIIFNMCLLLFTRLIITDRTAVANGALCLIEILEFDHLNKRIHV